MIALSIPSLPISVNKAYRDMHKQVKNKTIIIRAMTEAGKKYKLETTTYIARNFPTELKYFRENVPYLLVVHFQFEGRESLYNTTFPEEAKTRYKTLDVSNRLKLFEDALKDATGVDDSQNWIVVVSKGFGSEERTFVWVWDLEHDWNNPINNAIGNLLGVYPLQP